MSSVLTYLSGGERNARGCLNSIVTKLSKQPRATTEHWCLVLNLKMCLFRHWVTTFTQSDAVLKHKHRYVEQWTVGRAPKNARMFTTQRTEARLNAQIQRVELVISRALLLFCSGSLSGNETSFSASKPCWNSVTEMNVYRVFLVSNFMVFSFVSFKAILLVFV